MATTLKISHVAMRTKDVSAAANFYRELAGMEVIQERKESEHCVIWMRMPQSPDGLFIVFIEDPNLSGLPFTFEHFGIDVPSRKDVDEIAERARELGALVEGPGYGGRIIGYYCIVRDPDGNGVEFACEQYRV